MRLRDISINNLRRRKGKVFFLVFGLTIGITTVVSLISITRMMNDDISNKLDAFGANILIIPRSEDLALSYGGMSLGGVSIDVQSLRESDLPKIREIEVRDNLNTVSPKLIGVVEIEGKRVPLMGVLLEEELRLKKWWKIHGARPKAQDEVLLGSETAVQLFKSAGDTLSINRRALKVAGVLDETGSQDDFLIFADLKFVQDVMKKPGSLSLVDVSAFCNTCPIEEIVRQISKALPHAKVTAVKQTLETKMEAVDHFRKFSIGISVIVLLIGGLIVFTNMMASVNERKREIGIFRAIGFRKSHVVRIIFLEALIVGVIAGTLGFGLGIAVTRVVGPVITEAKGGFTVDPVLGIGAVLLSAIIGILSSAYPALHASKMDPTEALRSL
ncbi:MAG: ABC transporter permease [Deltaproteobacteria bacterium RBG_13_52_11b]|nr:MAG: ABC transporter permease [Deltaproteobacteria bacterium RBG_13_52_11b]